MMMSLVELKMLQAVKPKEVEGGRRMVITCREVISMAKAALSMVPIPGIVFRWGPGAASKLQASEGTARPAHEILARHRACWHWRRASNTRRREII